MIMENKKYLIIAKFEFTKVVRKPSFWLSTLFLPVLIGVVSFISGYSSTKAIEDMENIEQGFERIYVVDQADVIDSSLIVAPLIPADSYDEVISKVKDDSSNALVYIPQSFTDDLKYEFIYKKEQNLLTGINMTPAVNGLIKQSMFSRIGDPVVIKLLMQEPSGEIKSFNSEGVLETEGFTQYILPIASVVVFFFAVFISTTFLLESVSAEKENRMIETMLSIVDKKSLMFGKMIGLIGIVFLQLLLWVAFGILAYVMIQNYFELDLPIDFSNLDYSLLPLNIFLTISGFIFFAAIMVGVGAIGTGAQDSRNLSSIFIMLAIFPIYLMQVLIIDPSGLLAKVFSYFPFTSYMILIMRNSLAALDMYELVLGIVLTTAYSIAAIFIAFKLFELGCLMFNRRPTFKEVVREMFPHKS
jgi:ABC-2 type transport system permease protein